MSQIVRITGEISETTYLQVVEEVSAMEWDKPIKVYINSWGGTTIQALAIYDFLKKVGYRLDSVWHPAVTTIGTGQVYSAAVIILAAGRKVYLTPNTWVMVHEDSGKEKFNNIVALERETQQYRRMEEQWCKLLEVETGTSAEEWARLHKQTTYLDADECIKLGLVDEKV